MSKLIKRQDVIELIKNSYYDLVNSENDMWAMVADVEKLQVIDAVPVRYGHYIMGENGEYYCSECKRIDYKYSVARYCWFCGAWMQGEQNRF